MSSGLEPPKRIFRNRGYTGDNLRDAKVRDRLQKEIRAARDHMQWFSSLDSQNDPFDTNPALTSCKRADVKRVLDSFREEFGSYQSFSGLDLRLECRNRNISITKARERFHNPNRFLESVPRMLSDARKNQPICCFSSESRNPLMWSYYSASHESFCYEFELPSNLTALAIRRIGKIKYVNERPTVTPVELAKLLISSARPANTVQSANLKISEEEDARVTDALVLTKSKSWAHEAEWRMLLPIGTGDGYHPIAPYRLTRLIFGARASENLKTVVHELLEGSISTTSLRVSEHDYSLILDS